MAFPDGWAHRVAITIDAADIDADLTDWTLVFDQGFDSVLTQVNGPLDADGTRPSIDGGGDVRFSSDAAGTTQLAVDVRDWSTDNTPANGTCEVAVKVPSVSSSTDTTIYLWWGKAGETQPGAATTYGQYNAYDANHILVSPCACDVNRTATAITLTANNITPGDSTGKVGKATEYLGGGTQSRVTMTSGPLSFEYDDPFTIEAIARNDNPSAGVPQFIFSKIRYTTTYQGYSFLFNQGDFSWSINSGTGSQTGIGQAYSWTSGVWHQTAGTYTGSNSYTGFKIYVDGADIGRDPGQDRNDDASVGVTHSDPATIGARNWGAPNGEREWDGLLDELRVSNTVRGAAWIKANYHNQFNAAGFLTWGSITDISGDDDLTADDLETQAPTLGTPTLGQQHALAATDTEAQIPTLGTPAIGQGHALAADDIEAGSPVLGTPVLESVSTVDSLTAADLEAGSPVLGTPTIGQTHALTAAGLEAGAPVLGEPTLQSVAGLDNLTAADLEAGAPTLGTSTLGQVHALAADDTETQAPTLGSPTIGQTHALTATSLVAGAPVLGEPTLQSVAGLDNLTAADLEAGAPVLGSPAIGQVHALDAVTTTTGLPVLGEPTLGQTHELTAAGLEAQAPVLGEPALIIGGGTDLLTAANLVAGIPVLGTPTLGPPIGELFAEVMPSEIHARLVR
jgi:hypothetical protein